MTAPDAPDARWRERAACIGADPKLFTDPRPGTGDARDALAICTRCPVQAACLAEALHQPAHDDVGIWGATTEDNRRAMRRGPTSQGRSAPPPPALFPTLEGDLTDLTGRALVTELPTPPGYLLLIDHKPTLRADHLGEIWHHLTTYLHDLQPETLAPFALTATGELTDQTGRALITRLPAAPHLLVVIDGHPYRRTDTLGQACHDAVAALDGRVERSRRRARGLTGPSDAGPFPPARSSVGHHQSAGR